MPNKSQKGFAPLVLILVVCIVIIAIGGAFFFLRNPNEKRGGEQVITSQPPVIQNNPTSANTQSSVIWQQTEDGFSPMGTPPNCPEKIISQSPADISQVTSILYPGQTRGSDYKPHGGFRFDKATTNDITVVAPFDAKVIRGARYIADGEVQYTFDFMNDCGYMYRVGHLYTLTDQFAKLAEQFPEPKEGDSRTTNINPPILIPAGTKIATAVGLKKGKNTFFDFGVYDYRKPNAISTDTNWLKDPRHQNDLAKHAVCWFDMLPSQDAQIVKTLPAGDPTSGKNSDYCK